MLNVLTKPAGSRSIADRRWWETRWFVLIALVLAVAPLLWPNIPPLVDFPGHLGRYRVELGIDQSPFIARYYGFRWELIGNLGVDLLIIPMSKIFGLELGAKLIVIAIPALTALGLLGIAREVHGRVPAAALFALPLTYSYPFQFGFVNFCLSVALALCAFALWLRLDRLGRRRLRTAIFVPLAALIWLAHVVGWGVLGLLCFSAELLSPSRHGERLHRRLIGSVLACLPLALPFALMLVWRSGDVAGVTYDWFHWKLKWRWLYSVLREQNELWDLAGAGLLALVIIAGWLRGPNGIERRMALAAATLAAAFVLMPRIVFGSAYADMRLVPVMAAAFILAIRPLGRPWAAQAVAFLGLAFFTARIAGTTALYWTFDRAYDRQLAAIEHIPYGARVLAQVGLPCSQRWRTTRLEHVASMAIVRRDAFVNDQWVLPGAQLLSIRHEAARPYTRDPSQMSPYPFPCRREPQVPFPVTMKRFPRDAFDYLWLMNLPRAVWPRSGNFVEVYRNSNGVLYRVAH